jgi:Fe-S cluster biogenesis protein NfuA
METSAGTQDIARKVEEVLDAMVRPVLRRDGGEIRVEKITGEGTLVLVYKGRCSGCPGIEWTHSRIVEPAILATVKEITAVEWKFDYGGY